METLKIELEELYKEKLKIENKIKHLEEKIEKNSVFSFTLKDSIYIPIKNLSTPLINELKNLAIFPNPQIKILQNLRKPIYGIPTKIFGFELKENILKLPRGLMRDVIMILGSANIKYQIKDERLEQKKNFPTLKYTLREEQSVCVEAIKKKDFSIFVAPPGFGKTLIASQMISLRGVNTLIIVNKNMLLDQWIERFKEYLGILKNEIGILGKSQNTLNNHLDIATMQSLKNNPQMIQNYSFVIVDECHHIPALTFENIIKQFYGKYILGLSATPNRKDGMEPILFQQLGNISYEVKSQKTNKKIVEIIKSDFESECDNFGDLINEIINNDERNQLILRQIKLHQKRKILILTDRIEHINNLTFLLDKEKIPYVAIHGSLNKKEKEKNLQLIEHSSLVLATSSYFGEGIDFPHLDTIIFATPISYSGRLIQYLGRIGRKGDDCLAIDILDIRNNFTKSAFNKRKEGYESLFYKIKF
jgi:superfamily II DNA or RNA helicase